MTLKNLITLMIGLENKEIPTHVVLKAMDEWVEGLGEESTEPPKPPKFNPTPALVKRRKDLIEMRLGL